MPTNVKKGVVETEREAGRWTDNGECDEWTAGQTNGQMMEK